MRKLKTGLWKKAVSCTIIAGLIMSVTACGKSSGKTAEPGVANSDTSQTEFTVMGGMSALSKGYEGTGDNLCPTRQAGKITFPPLAIVND